jgi:hypothetical protein
MTRAQFDSSVQLLQGLDTYQSLSEIEQRGMIESVIEIELPGLLEALQIATRDQLAGYWPDLAEQIKTFSSAQEAYENLPALRTALDERDARRYLTRHLEEAYTPDGEAVTLAELLDTKPKLATGPDNHLPVVVQIIWQFANPSQAEGAVPHEDLDTMFWQPQFGCAFPWEEKQ